MKKLLHLGFLLIVAYMFSGCTAVHWLDTSKQHIPEQTHRYIEYMTFEDTNDGTNIYIELSIKQFENLEYYKSLDKTIQKEIHSILPFLTTNFALYEASLAARKRGYKYFTIDNGNEYSPINTAEKFRKYCFAYLYGEPQIAYCPQYKEQFVHLMLKLTKETSIHKPMWKIEDVIEEFKKPIQGTKYDKHINAMCEERRKLIY